MRYLQTVLLYHCHSAHLPQDLVLQKLLLQQVNTSSSLLSSCSESAVISVAGSLKINSDPLVEVAVPHALMDNRFAGREWFEYDPQYHPVPDESRQSSWVLPESAG